MAHRWNCRVATSNESAKEICDSIRFLLGLYCFARSDAKTNPCNDYYHANRAGERERESELERESEGKWRKKKSTDKECLANGLQIAKKMPAFACQWQFLSYFRSCFNWIVIEFYFTTAIFHTHSVQFIVLALALVLVRLTPLPTLMLVLLRALQTTIK